MLSPSNDHSNHLHQRRAIRADLPGRSSVFSQASDAPSVYSSTSSLQHNAPSSPTHSRYKSPRNSMNSRRTNADRLNDTAVSTLDLDEDWRSSTASSDFSADGHQSANNGDDEPLPRMSLLGPKMRFHSRAPWEDQDALQEEEEPDYDSFLSTAKRGLGFSSPRVSNNSRPSGESARSPANSRGSFEKVPPQGSYNPGVPYPFLQEDPPTSLERQVTPDTVPPNSSRPSSPTLFLSDAHSSTHPHFSDISSSSGQGRTFTLSHFPSRRRQSPSSDDVHPYANPDHTYDQHRLSNESGVLRDSMSIVTDSTITSTLSKFSAKHIRVPETSMTSVISKDKASMIHGKGISSPMISPNTTFRPEPRSHENDDLQFLMPPQKNVVSFPGWTDRNTPPTFELISLEEARAKRSRSVTADSVVSRQSTSTQLSSSAIILPSSRHERASVTIDQDESGRDAAASRIRSISAGPKTKNILHTIVGGHPRSDRQIYESGSSGNIGGLPGKALKHKKSGFMRLFNGARQDREERTQPPPVPSLPGAHATHNDTQQIEQKLPKTMQRIPVPKFSVPEVTGRQHNNPPPDDAIRPSPPPSPKRPLPSLSIDTMSRSSSTISSVGELPFQTGTVPGSRFSGSLTNKLVPQTAPASISEFPPLKLRPISTMFSAQFGDHVIQDPSLDTDPGTPDSSCNNLSPLTPNSAARSDLPSGNKPASDGQSSILQESIISAKMAWQRHVWELEGQVRDLKAEVEGLRAASSDGDYCHACGRGEYQKAPTGHRPPGSIQEVKNGSVVHRPRAQTGTSSRFASAMS